jgi:hypothetical protein
MPERDTESQPVVAAPLLLQRTRVAPVSAALAAGGLLLAALWFAPGIFDALRAPDGRPHLPASPDDLGPGVVTPVDPFDRPAVAAAISALKVTDAQRQGIERDVIEGRRRIGWIVVMDSMDPDGDTIAIEAGGLVQIVVLTKAWTPVPVLLGSGSIGVSGIKDGAGGGITLALATRSGPLNLRPLVPGERIEVAAP